MRCLGYQLVALAGILFLGLAAASHHSYNPPALWKNLWNYTVDDFLSSSLARTSTSVLLAVQGLMSHVNAVKRLDPATGEVLQVLENSGLHVGFGASVAAAGGYVAVGLSAAYDTHEAVMVYAVDSTTGSLSWAFNVTENLAGACYGCAIALTETHLVVGAVSKFPSGAVYVYSMPSGALLWSNFSSSNVQPIGAAVAANSRYVAVSGLWHGTYNAGVVWVMDIHTGDIVNQTYSNGQDGFGNALAMSETLLAVGAEYAPVGINPWTPGPGAVSLFSVDGAGVSSLGVLSGEYSYNEFGASLAVCGNNVIVGAPNYPYESNDYRSEGKVYYYNGLVPLGSLSGGTGAHTFGLNVLCNDMQVYATLRQGQGYILTLVALELEAEKN